MKNEEQLKQEAIVKYKTGSYPQLHPDHYTFIHGYLAGAEPREKRIAELEEKLANADYQLEGRDNEIRELKADNDARKFAMAMSEKVEKQLRKENAELRKTETMLKVLKDRGVIKSWYYNGSYHVGNELPR